MYEVDQNSGDLDKKWLKKFVGERKEKIKDSKRNCVTIHVICVIIYCI